MRGTEKESMSAPHHRFELSVKQVAASALAAASAAVAASTLGVAGTVIGAAVMSVVATVGSAVYGHSIARTQETLRRVRPAPESASTGSTAAPRRVRPLAVAGTTGLVFALAVGGLTLVEVVGQRPVASMVSGDRTNDRANDRADDGAAAATTLGQLTGGSTPADEAKPGNGREEPAGAGAPAADPAEEPAPSPSPTAGGDTPTPTPSPTPTDPPVSPRPARSNPPDSPAAAP